MCAERCKHGFDVREIGNTLLRVTSHVSSNPLGQAVRRSLNNQGTGNREKGKGRREKGTGKRGKGLEHRIYEIV